MVGFWYIVREEIVFSGINVQCERERKKKAFDFNNWKVDTIFLRKFESKN